MSSRVSDVQTENVPLKSNEQALTREEITQQWPYKMKDLCNKTNLPRQVIHFYIQQKLLPEGRKTGKNMAYYGDEHIERIFLIRKLQHERFLPLRAIKALIDQREDIFTQAQLNTLREVKSLMGSFFPPIESRQEELVNAIEYLEKYSLSLQDLQDFEEISVMVVVRDSEQSIRIAKKDLWILELYSKLRSAGFTRELGFTPADIAVYEDAISQMFRRESELAISRLGHLAPQTIATMLHASIPIVNELLGRLHTEKVKILLETV